MMKLWIWREKSILRLRGLCRTEFPSYVSINWPLLSLSSGQHPLVLRPSVASWPPSPTCSNPPLPAVTESPVLKRSDQATPLLKHPTPQALSIYPNLNSNFISFSLLPNTCYTVLHDIPWTGHMFSWLFFCSDGSFLKCSLSHSFHF